MITSQINLESLQFQIINSLFLNNYIAKMNNSRQKSSHPETYSDYLIENNYFMTNQCEPQINYYKNYSHKRKSSQISTLSYKSKNRNISSIDQINHSLTKQSPHLVASNRHTTLKSIKTHKKSLLKRQFSLERIKISQKNKNTLTSRKQKLKINTDRKLKPKTTDNLTQRCINYEKTKGSLKNVIKNDKNSQSSFANKCQNAEHKINIEKKRKSNQKRVICHLKLRQKNLELIVSRCSKVMTEYYERMTLLKKQNEILRHANIELHKYQLSSTKDKSIE